MPFPLDATYLDKAEAALGARLPAAYREMMMAVNGGDVMVDRVQWSLHPVFDTSDKKRLKRTCNHIVLETESRTKWGGFPEGAVEIAADGSGNALVLLRENAEFSVDVHEFDHETHRTRPSGLTVADLAAKRKVGG